MKRHKMFLRRVISAVYCGHCDALNYFSQEMDSDNDCRNIVGSVVCCKCGKVSASDVLLEMDQLADQLPRLKMFQDLWDDRTTVKGATSIQDIQKEPCDLVKSETPWRLSQLIFIADCPYCESVNYFDDTGFDDDMSKMDVDGMECWTCKKESYMYARGEIEFSCHNIERGKQTMEEIISE